MADKRFKALPGDFGTMAEVTGTLFGASPVGASATTVYYLPITRRKTYFRGGAAALSIVAAGSAAITATLGKIPSGNGAFVPLTSALDIKAGVPVGTNTAFVIPSTVTDAQRTFAQGDVLAVQLIAAGTVTTQPANLAIAADILIQQ